MHKPTGSYQLALLRKLRLAESQQTGISTYNPFVEAVCLYQKEIIVKRMVSYIRERFYIEANHFMGDWTLREKHPVAAANLATAQFCSIPYVNISTFHVLAQYAIIHAGLSTGFDEVFDGLYTRTQFIRREKLSGLPAVPKFRLKMDDSDYFLSKDVVEWYPDWYPRIFFIDEQGNERPAITETEQQILLGLSSPKLEYIFSHTQKPIYQWNWSDCVRGIELISLTQAIARLTYEFPNWVIKQDDVVMQKHLFRLRVEQRKVYTYGLRAFHRSIYQNTPGFRKEYYKGVNTPFKL